jgi:hypothetical protein
MGDLARWRTIKVVVASRVYHHQPNLDLAFLLRGALAEVQGLYKLMMITFLTS